MQVILAAGDTFRAAAAEQLSEWATRSGAKLVSSQKEKARPDNVLWTAVDQVSLAAPSQAPSGDCDQRHQRELVVSVMHWALVCFWGQ